MNQNKTIENTIIENELIVHIFILLREVNQLNNDILTEILNTFIFGNYNISLETYVLLQIVLKLDINQNNKVLINCILSKIDNMILSSMHEKSIKISDNPFAESEIAITPFNKLYEMTVSNKKE